MGPSLDRRRRGGALLRYTLSWVALGGLLVGAAVLLLPRDEQVRLPPVQQIDLMQAALSAGCELGIGGHALPTRGPAGRAAEPRFYDDPVSAGGLVGATRVCIVVFHFKPTLSREMREELGRLQAAVPRGTIVVPNPAMRYALAATAWQRSLGCPRPGRDAIDALRLFRGRYLGGGPGPT